MASRHGSILTPRIWIWLSFSLPYSYFSISLLFYVSCLNISSPSIIRIKSKTNTVVARSLWQRTSINLEVGGSSPNMIGVITELCCDKHKYDNLFNRFFVDIEQEGTRVHHIILSGELTRVSSVLYIHIFLSPTRIKEDLKLNIIPGVP